MTWRVADSLEVLRSEVNTHAPNRSTVSDGSIGDEAHASRTSDHNPWVIDEDGVGVVRARDFTHDPAGGLDCNWLAKELVRAMDEGHPAMGSGAYVIWNDQIISQARRAEGWREYSGSNEHRHHLHVSVATAAAGYDSEAPWGLLTPARPKHVPIEVGFANLNQFQGHDRRLVRSLCSGHDALVLVECIRADGTPLPLDDWIPASWSVTHDTSSAARAGTAVLWRNTVLKRTRRPRWTKLADAILPGPGVQGDGMRARYAPVQGLEAIASGEKYRLGGAHFAPGRYDFTWAGTMLALRRLRFRPMLPPLVLGVDANQPIIDVAGDLRMRAHGRGIVGLLTTRRVRVLDRPVVSRAAIEANQTDHPTVSITIQRRRRKHR